jgi:hypothetical protein
MKKKLLALTLSAASVFGGVSAVSAATPEATIPETTKDSGVVQPLDSILRGQKQSKTEPTPYGSASMTVTYDRNLTTSTSTITGIASTSASDPYLALHDKYYNPGSATAVFYDKTHKTYVRVVITADECN